MVGLRSIPASLDLDPRRVEARAALYSFGFLVRRAAAVLLDINEWELRVGLRVVRDSQGNVAGQIFLTDTLENGAGYCSQFASPEPMERLLRSGRSILVSPSSNRTMRVTTQTAARHRARTAYGTTAI